MRESVIKRGDEMKEITQLLKTYTIEELAVKIGVAGKTIYRWKNGTSKPHRIFKKKIIKLAERTK